MNANLDFAEQVHVVSGFLPVDMAAGANTGDWVSLKLYGKVTVIFVANIGQNGEDPTITFEQAVSVSGSPKDLDVIDKVYVKQAASDLLSTGTFSVVTQTKSKTYTEGAAGEQAKLWVIDFYADELDVANGYDCFRASIADTGTDAANVPYGAILYLLWPPRYGEQTLLSAIID